MTPRRELQLAVALCLLGSLVVLWALGRTWVTEVDLADLTIAGSRTEVRGSEIAEGAQALGLVGLAAVVALAATRRWGRVLVGVVVLGAGTAVVAVAGGVLGRQGCDGTCRRLADQPLTAPGWAWLALAGGAVLTLGGLLVAVRGRRWGGLSSSYEAPGGPPPEPVTHKGVWDALDRGDDPTA